MKAFYSENDKETVLILDKKEGNILVDLVERGLGTMKRPNKQTKAIATAMLDKVLIE